MVERVFNAKVDELSNVTKFIEVELEKLDFDLKMILQFNLVVEELFVNIANYAYKEKDNGKCKITFNYDNEKKEVTLSIEDNGIKFNPLEKENPNFDIPGEERPVGGLGIYLVKNIMDNIEYKYEDNKNILIVKKDVK